MTVGVEQKKTFLSWRNWDI